MVETINYMVYPRLECGPFLGRDEGMRSQPKMVALASTNPGTLDTSQAPHRAAFALQGRTLPPCTIALAKGIIVFMELFRKLHPFNLLLPQLKLPSSLLLQESFSARTFWTGLGAVIVRICHLMYSTYLLRAIHNCTRQAPNLTVSQHERIRDMVLSKSLRNAQMAKIARCSMRSIRTIRTNLRCFGTTKAPPNRVGRPRSITPPMLSALCDRLIEKPHMYRDETALFLWDEFDVQVTSSSIRRASGCWSKKIARRAAQKRNADLRNFYLYNLSEFRSYHLFTLLMQLNRPRICTSFTL